MEIAANEIVFYVLSVVIVVFSILTVTTRRILRAATYLLFVLIGTAGLYLLLNYHFLAVVQIMVYAGGIVVLFIFSILLTSHAGDKAEPLRLKDRLLGLSAALAGVALVLPVILMNTFGPTTPVAADEQIDMTVIGSALMGAGKYQYILPFEAISILLLACIVGGILIARKR